MQDISAKAVRQARARWQSLFLKEHKEKTGKYTLAGYSDWSVLASLTQGTLFDARAEAAYDAAQSPDGVLIWGDSWFSLSAEKPSRSTLWDWLEENTDDAVYVTHFDADGQHWTYVVTHEDPRSIYLAVELTPSP